MNYGRMTMLAKGILEELAFLEQNSHNPDLTAEIAQKEADMKRHIRRLHSLSEPSLTRPTFAEAELVVEEYKRTRGQNPTLTTFDICSDMFKDLAALFMKGKCDHLEYAKAALVFDEAKAAHRNKNYPVLVEKEQALYSILEPLAHFL